CDINLHVAGGVRAVVEIALGILREDIDGRRRNLVMHRQRCEYGLDTACRTEQVTRHGLGRVHHQLVGMIAHRKLKGHGFVAVAQRRGGAVRIHVVDVLWRHTRILKRVHHAAPRTVAVRRGDVIGVGAHAVAREFTVNASATLACVFVLFQHQHTGTFAEHETIAIDVPGARGSRGIVVAGGQGTHRGKAAYAQRRHGGFRSACHHDVGVAVFNKARGIANGMQTRCAGRDHCIRGTLEAQHDGELPGHQVDQRGGNEERRNATRAAFHVFDLLLFDTRQAADAGTNDGTDTFGIDLVDIQTRIAPSLDTCGNTVMDEGIHGLGLFGRQVLRDVETFDFTRDLGVERRGIETRDATDPGATIDEIVPRGIYIVADRRNNTKTGYDDTSFHG